MAVQKGEHTAVKDFADLGQLTKSQTTQKEGTMPNKKAAAGAASDEKLSDEAILAKAAAEGYDTNKPHPSVMELASAINPYGASMQEEGTRWILKIASGDPENPMDLGDFIVESYRDPAGFNLLLAQHQGSRNAETINGIVELTKKSDRIAQENALLRRENDQLIARLAERPALAALGNDFTNVVQEAVDHVKSEVTHDIAATATAGQLAVQPARPTKPVATVPEKAELITVRVEERGFWETTATAVATGVVVAAAAYGTYRALDYFFGDDA